MKALILAMLASSSIKVLACVPAFTKDVLIKVTQPGRKDVKLTYGGNEFLYSELLMRIPLQMNEKIKSITYDKELLTDEVVMSTEVPSSAHFKVETVQLAKVDGVYSGETEVVVLIDDKKGKSVRVIKQKVNVETLGTPRGC